MNRADVIIIGAGIVGLAHGLAAAKKGLSVVIFERHPQAVGASIRNFGMIWPIGQPQGKLSDRALRSRDIWLEIAAQAGIAIDPCGSLHLAYREDELAVLQEFIDTTDRPGIALLTPDKIFAKSPAVNPKKLLGALWSPTEVIVDPREAIAKIPLFLTQAYPLQIHWNTAVTAINFPQILAGTEIWQANHHIFLCSGIDFETLYPSLYQNSGLTKVKLQMMRTVPQPEGFKIGVPLCGGLTLTHYSAFSHCPSLPTLKSRIQQETPHFPQWGIHVMMSQNATGELILGDSHEYGLNLDPFDRSAINQYILAYLQSMVQVPTLEIAQTWHGVYAKLAGKTEWIETPQPGVTLVNALGGAGMTLSFGLAEEIVGRSL